jgi:hypothetical protein
MTYEAVVSLDIDSTQYVHYDASEDSASYVLKHTLESLKDAGKILVVHNTGRPYPWACHGEQIERYLKPIIADPNYLISHAGTVIWDSELKNPSEVWRNTILEICPPDAVQDLIRTLDREGYKFDPETFGNEFKVCIKTSPEEHPAAVASIKALITEKYPSLMSLIGTTPVLILRPEELIKALHLISYVHRKGLCICRSSQVEIQ